MSVYNDKNISLKDIALTQFELAREIPAALELIANKPQNLDIQTRMLIIRINAALHNFKSMEKITIAIGIDFLAFLNPMLNFLHGAKRKNLDVFSFDPASVTKQNKITTELSSFIKKENIFSSDAKMISSAIKQKSFLIALLGPQSLNPARECLDAFSMGKQGLLLIHNYAIEKSPSHHLYAVERGLRIIEQPDGSGECFCV